MTATELATKLLALAKEHGDLPVVDVEGVELDSVEHNTDGEAAFVVEFDY